YDLILRLGRQNCVSPNELAQKILHESQVIPSLSSATNSRLQRQHCLWTRSMARHIGHTGINSSDGANRWPHCGHAISLMATYSAPARLPLPAATESLQSTVLQLHRLSRRPRP